ncbi:unnamed protein product [Calicophoron daubneyi]|uniref:Antiviral helicase SKI2 n=1 Tax=Calicophoron daubneyi TaxID=300641 RepID=A0AAV2TFT1_CALDB
MDNAPPFLLHAFLEPCVSDATRRELNKIPNALFPSEPLIPKYVCDIHRDFETGEVAKIANSSPIDYSLHISTGTNLLNVKDPSVIAQVGVLSDENHRKIRDRFSLSSTLLTAKEVNNRNIESGLDYEKYLSVASASVLAEWGVPISSHSAGGYRTFLPFERLEPGTKSMLLKRSIGQNPVKKYAVMEDTAQRLPSLSKLIPDPAYTWDFELDTFQKQAILCLERNQSVFVSAHTSAGKTVVAEYACALCRRRGSRVIYTSPIKALSNQKFHDFRRTFGEDVGLLTGDIKVATNSSFLVMTTEILHNMLCNAADTIRDLEIVIMDEVHYLNDAERGHVWEQIMIMLPKHVLLVMLSATVPNTFEFADWLGRIRGSEIHVVATDKRPVPLEHYLFTGLDGQDTAKQLHLIADQTGQFNTPGYKQAFMAFTAPKIRKKPKEKEDGDETTNFSDKNVNSTRGGNAAGGRGGKKGANSRQHFTGGKMNTPGRWNYMPSSGGMSVHEKRTKNLWLGVVRLLKERELMPAIAFGFSRNALEVLASHLSSVDLLDKNEKNEVHQFLRFSLKNRLKGPDVNLPSVIFITDLVLRGLAVHHAGMLPLLKETVEMLFQRGLVRLLFATETFAMGVNMPARCVIFSTLEKYDGRRRRPLNPGEYTQMAGRAGRRGLDASGTVLILVDGIGQSITSKCGMPTPETLMSIILGKPTQLASQFKITYSMILHLHRTNWLSPQDVMRRSFMEAPALRREIDRRQHLTRLKALLASTTTLIPSAGSASTSSTSIETWKGKHIQVSAATVPVGEPVLQVKCPLGQVLCAEAMGIYYQACCKFRQLNSSVSIVLGSQSLPDLQRVFCPGRLLIIQIPDPSLKSNPIRASTVPNWLLPAVVVDLKKVFVQGTTEIQWNLLTWQTPSKADTTSSYRLFQPAKLDTSGKECSDPSNKEPPSVTIEDAETSEQTEEEILRDGEDRWMSRTPFPPQLMPVFVPASFEDGLSRLILVPDQTSRCIVRICDQVINFKSGRVITNSSVTVSELLLRAIKRHRQELAAAEAGLCLVVGTNTSAADSELPELLNEVNQGLNDLVRQFVPKADDDSQPVFYGLPPDVPPPLNVSRALRLKQNIGETSSLFDELWMLSDELTTPLLSSAITQRLAPVTCPDLVAHLALFHRTCRRRWAVKRLETSLSDDKLSLKTEYLGRLRVLEELGFIDAATERGCLSLKGLVACELQQMEVLLTQLLLDGSFTQLPPADIAALLSCFVFELRAADTTRDEKSSNYTVASTEPTSNLTLLDTASTKNFEGDKSSTLNNSTVPADSTGFTPKLASVPDHLQEPVRKMFEFASNLEQLQRKHGLADPSSDTRLNASLVNVTYAWATGHPFSTLVHLTEVQEGFLVRGLLRLDELLRHVCNACHRLGDQALGLKMNEARNAIHRDLICAPSLYISEEFVYQPDEEQAD